MWIVPRAVGGFDKIGPKRQNAEREEYGCQPFNRVLDGIVSEKEHIASHSVTTIGVSGKHWNWKNATSATGSTISTTVLCTKLPIGTKSYRFIAMIAYG